MLPIKTILCPTDFSEASYKGLKAADELAAEFSAEIILLFTITPFPDIPGSSPPASFDLPEILESIESSAGREITKIRDEHLSAATSVREAVIVGDPAIEIVKLAAEENVDVIVMSTHGQSGWKRLVTGSVAEKVVRMAQCPVLTVHGSRGKSSRES